MGRNGRNTTNWKSSLAQLKGALDNNRNDSSRKNDETDNKGGNTNQSGKPQSKGTGDKGNIPNASARMATAPYNFVTLPDRAMPSPLDQGLDWAGMEEEERQARFKEYILSTGKFSGRLELEMEAVTPIFVGGNGETFFAPAGKPVIPGSTLRGMTKNLLKIVTCGSMRPTEDFYDHHLYFRYFASGIQSLRDNYNKRMVKKVPVLQKDGTTKNKPRTKASPGFLIRIAGEYFMCPAQAKIEYNPRICNQGAGIQWYDNGEVDIFTGFMYGKKTYVHFKDPAWDEKARIPVPKEVVAEYRADKNRPDKKNDGTDAGGDYANSKAPDKSRDGLNLFDNGKYGAFASGFTHIKDVDFVVPCYFVENDGVVEHFGHGRYYRIAYKKSIGDHVPESVRKPVVDFADAMFGSKELWAGRLYFEDAALCGPQTVFGRDFPHPLMKPNPTSFQLYLKQNGSQVSHWDSDTDIRGYKLYWHHNIGEKEWRRSPDEKAIEGTKRIEPLGKGSRFKGCIRFSQLSDLEVGALCSVFHLDKNGEDIVYKLGQGKSIGMGSVRIKAKLYIEDTANCYGSLFQGGHWNDGMQEADDSVYRQAFTGYQDNALGQDRKRFDTGMGELRLMMDWKHTSQEGWAEKLAPMNPTDKNDTRLKDRIPLDNASDFVRRNLRK